MKQKNKVQGNELTVSVFNEKVKVKQDCVYI